MYKQHSIVITGNFNADFKLLTHNRYSVLNGHFVRQIHPSSLSVAILTLSDVKFTLLTVDYVKILFVSLNGGNQFSECHSQFAIHNSIVTNILE